MAAPFPGMYQSGATRPQRKSFVAHLTWIKAASRAEVAVGGRLINDPELEPTPYNSRSIVSRAHRNLYIDKKGTKCESTTGPRDGRKEDDD